MDRLAVDACPSCGGDRVGSHGMGVLGGGGRIVTWRAYVLCSDCGTMGAQRDHVIERLAHVAAVNAWNGGCRAIRRRQLLTVRRAGAGAG